MEAQKFRTKQAPQSDPILETAYFTLTLEERAVRNGGRAFCLHPTGGRIRAGTEHVLPTRAELSPVLEDRGESVILEGFAGVSLEQRLEYGSLSQGEALTVLKGVALSLEEMHRMGFVHGTLRMDSLLVDDSLRVNVIDWMLEWPDPSRAQMQALFRSAAAELLVGEPIGPRTDQFALGALAHRLLFGALPFGAATPAESLLNAMAGVWNSADESGLKSEALDRVFSPDPAQRYSSCSHFLEALELELTQSSSPVPISAVSEPMTVALKIENLGTNWAMVCVWAAGACAAIAFLFGAMSWRTQLEIARTQTRTTAPADSVMAAIAENSRMKVCNTSAHEVFIRDLAVAYWNAERRLQVFESGHAIQQGWTVAPASEQNLSWNSSGNKSGDAASHSSWDGSVVFYFLRVEQEGKEYVLSGTWARAGHDCLTISSP